MGMYCNFRLVLAIGVAPLALGKPARAAFEHLRAAGSALLIKHAVLINDARAAIAHPAYDWNPGYSGR
jgi:hypothetical protein